MSVYINGTSYPPGDYVITGGRLKTTAELDSMLRRDSNVIGGKEMSSLNKTVKVNVGTRMGTMSSPDFGKIMTHFTEADKYHPFACACIYCTSSPKSMPAPVIPKTPLPAPKYDDLYWKFVYANSWLESRELLEQLMNTVTTEMEPGEGTWTHKLDPIVSNRVVRKEKKLDFFLAFEKMNWKAKFFSVMCLVQTITFSVVSLTGHIH